tara:strand:- start:341 stop:541 length:201 start_codon:yes stop_codon:yes gene_type:complete
MNINKYDEYLSEYKMTYTIAGKSYSKTFKAKPSKNHKEALASAKDSLQGIISPKQIENSNLKVERI